MQDLSGAPTEVSYIEQSVCMKVINTKNTGTFEFGVKRVVNIPLKVIKNFQENSSSSHHYEDRDVLYGT